jgi:hypothetical protein
VLGTCVSLLSAGRLEGCTCIAFEFGRDVEKYPIILLGKAIELAEHRTADPYARMVDVSFRVLQLWKGEVPISITIRTNRYESACGFPFAVGRHYVVFVWRDLSPAGTDRWLLETNSCSPTAAAGKAGILMAQLDGHFGKRTSPPPDEESSAAQQ